jgi:hypothetical protein
MQRVFHPYLEYTVHEPNPFDPFLDQCLSRGSLPILLQVSMTFWTQPAAIVMAKTTFQGLVTCPIKFAAIVL